MKQQNFRLIENQVIRLKIANMSRQVESTQAWLESIYFQVKFLSKEEADKILAGKGIMKKDKFFLFIFFIFGFIFFFSEIRTNCIVKGSKFSSI